ncbi:hypothetical protein BDZ94DRAFT_1139162, partial [Collybia nuda]
IGIDPCGWCGRDGCTTQIVETNTVSVKINSNCEYYYTKKQYKRAMSPTSKTPCINIPLRCPLC